MLLLLLLLSSLLVTLVSGGILGTRDFFDLISQRDFVEFIFIFVYRNQ
jgi:hypothetical protein